MEPSTLALIFGGVIAVLVAMRLMWSRRRPRHAPRQRSHD